MRLAHFANLMLLNPVFFLFFCPLFAQEKSPQPKKCIISELTPLYNLPQKGLLPQIYFEKNDTCTIDSTFVDSMDAAWFMITKGERSGWSRAETIRFASDSDNSQQQRSVAKDSDKERNRRYSIVRNHPDWSRRIQKAVRDGKVCLEMNEEQLKASWGEPVHKGKAFLLGMGNYDVWFYTGTDGRTLMVGFSEGKVTGWSVE